MPLVKTLKRVPLTIPGKLKLKHFIKKMLRTGTNRHRTQKNRPCYNRKQRSQLSVVDSHLHLRPFGGPPIPFNKMINIFRKSGVLFVEAEGIGQRLPSDSTCTYYLDCPHVDVKPSIQNDIDNAQSVLNNKLEGIVLNLSMTFPDLANPETILPQMRLLEKEYPGMFKWMGEVNLVKQALFNNGHTPVPLATIKKWAPFMAMLRRKGFPFSIHCDLGNDRDPLLYLPLMRKVLRLYPKNKIVWMHLGLSKELTRLDPYVHTALLGNLLAQYPRLYMDISWQILYDQEFKDPESRCPYVELLNTWPKRFLPGTDFISALKNSGKEYKKELGLTSNILKSLNDDAFRRIALGQNFFDISNTNAKYEAPQVCNF
jgi:hypothetical protein